MNCLLEDMFSVARAATAAMQRREKHASTTREELLSTSSVPRSYLKDIWDDWWYAASRKVTLTLTNPSSRQRGCYIRSINAGVQLGKKKSDRGPQGV
jgi:hypothetical protein